MLAEVKVVDYAEWVRRKQEEAASRPPNRLSGSAAPDTKTDLVLVDASAPRKAPPAPSPSPAPASATRPEGEKKHDAPA